MIRDSYKIFSEAEIAGLKLKNRLVRSATYEAAMTKDGMITDKMLMLYKNLAEGGIGLIITGHTTVAANGKANPKQVCLFDDKFINEIKLIADIVHKAGSGCKIFAQISHAGRQVMHDNHDAEPVGPSDIPCPVLKKSPRSLSAEEIQNIIKAFSDAIVRVQKAGFDGVQIHAAHGWLISSFLSPYTNKRTDEYGGSVTKRVKILRDIVSSAKQKVGRFPIIAKINCEDHVAEGIGRDSFKELILEIEKIGLDAIEVSGGMWDCLSRSKEELGFIPVPIPEARTRISDRGKQSYFLDYVRKLDLSIPVILVGGNRNIESMERILSEGDVSFFSMSRPLIKEPDLPKRWLEGRGKETAECVSCNSCLLMVKLFYLSCMLNQSKIIQKIVKNATPMTWKLIFK
ncbi:MAG: NADH:flavin oxidoreductase [Syntrophaceae bacterium]|nr:NADH:flavin oxidoreductase [Syntrophaceae bacterium]